MSKDMKCLMDFRAWAVKLGHYQAIAAVDRYLAFQERLKEKEDDARAIAAHQERIKG